MHRIFSTVVALAVFVPLGPASRAAQPTAAPQLIDDRQITIHSARDVIARRRALAHYLWGDDGFPSRRLPDSVVTNIPAPVHHLDHLARVDEISVELMPGLKSVACHFLPQRPNGELVVVHHGHGCTMDDDPSGAEAGYGLQRTIAGLLERGYGVLGVFMPHMRPGDCTGRHDALCETGVTGSPLKFFVEPVAVCLNYLQRWSNRHDFPSYRAFHMIGLSGGGWTTTLYAALDPRIRRSFPVAGTIPLYLRSGGSIGDREQYEAAFYSQAGYLDLYILGAHGRGRKQTQILNRRDDCCFGEAQHQVRADGLGYPQAMFAYEQQVRDVLARIGPGIFQLKIDEAAPSHMISHHALREFIFPELRATAAPSGGGR